MFQKLDYKKWIIENQIHELFDVDINEYGEINSKIEKNIYETVDPENKIPFPPELDDLTCPKDLDELEARVIRIKKGQIYVDAEPQASCFDEIIKNSNKESLE